MSNIDIEKVGINKWYIKEIRVIYVGQLSIKKWRWQNPVESEYSVVMG